MKRSYLSECAAALGCMLIMGTSSAYAAKTVITMMYHGQSSVEWKRLETTYEKSHPGVDIKMIPNADSWPAMFEKLAVMNAAGSAVDIIHVNRESMGFANRGLFVDLTSYMRTAKLDRKVMPDGSWRQFSLKGKLVAIPFAVFPTVMLYNQSLFSQSGLPFLPKDWEDNTFNLDSMSVMLKKLTKDANGDGKIDQYGTASWMIEIIQKAEGAEWVDPDTNKATANSKAMTKAFNYWYGLKNTSHVVLDDEGQTRLKINWDYFSSGKVGLLSSGTWSFSMYAKSPFRWDVGIAPKGAQRATNITVDGIAMGSLCRNKTAAWSFLKWLTYDKNGATLLNDAMGGVPSMKSLIGRYIDREQAANPKLSLNVVEKSLDYASITNLHLYANETVMSRNIDEQLLMVDKGKKSIASALDAIQDILTRLLKG